MILLRKIKMLLGGKKKHVGTIAAYSERLQKQPRYKAKYPGAESGRKSFRSRFATRRGIKAAGQQSSSFSAQLGTTFWRRLLLCIVLAVVLGFAGKQLQLSPLQGFFDQWAYFRIQTIEMPGCHITDPAELKKIGGIHYQLNMLTLDPAVMQKRLQEHPWVSGVKIQRIWPDTLVVTVSEHRPEALIVCGEENKFSYVNRKGEIFAAVRQGQELDFPVITGLETVQGSRKDEMLVDAMRFLQLTRRNNSNLPGQDVSEVHLTENGELIVYLVRYPFPIYFGQGNVKRKYTQLWKVLKVLYQKSRSGSLIEKVAYIRMDYQDNKVLVARSSTG